MDQEQALDFKALMAKFQDQEILLKQPKVKPALPEKPKVVPLPPQSPTHYLPAGARPSLLTSINQNLSERTAGAPRVVFKDDKKESKKPLIPIITKGKDKSEGKLKGSKDKAAKASEEKIDDDSSDQKQKRESIKDRKLPLLLPVLHKESTAELVPAAPPPKVPAPKKKGFMGFRKSLKKSAVVPSDPILDMPSSDVPGAAPLIPVPSDFDDVEPKPEISTPEALLPNVSTSTDSSVTMEVIPPSAIPASPDFTPPPAFIPDIPAPELPTPESETQPDVETPPAPELPTPEGETPPDVETLVAPELPTPEGETQPALPISRPASQNEIIAIPPSVPTPPPSCAQQAISTPSSVTSSLSSSPSPPEPETAALADVEAASMAAVDQPPPPVPDPPSTPPSPKAERPNSALFALERAEDMNPGKRTTAADQRILNALEKARRKVHTSSLPQPTAFLSNTPPEELPPPHSPTRDLHLPPTDYEERARQLNGVDHVEEGSTEKGSEVVPMLLVVPPPLPKKILSDPESLGPAPEKPTRPRSANVHSFIPPPPLPRAAEIPAELSETDHTQVDDASPEPPASQWVNGENDGPDAPDGRSLPEVHSNGPTGPAAEVQAGLEDKYQSNQPPDLPELPTSEVVEAATGSSHDTTDNVYENIVTSAKKKGKTDGGKKRKGPPKNPYAEAEAKEEKIKTGRFGKLEKKVPSEGPDEKELKKREKQRLEKEKKELKERQEKEKKEQKEKEKKDNEMKKKFKCGHHGSSTTEKVDGGKVPQPPPVISQITGQEDAMYKATVTVTTKGRKNDLPIKSGDNVSIIRTTNCPKGKWLARDDGSNYGYIAVDHVELDIKEMLELGKKTVTRNTSSNVMDAETTRTGSRTSDQYPRSGSFSDDSEEWTADDEEPLSSPSSTAEALVPTGHSRTLSMPDTGNTELSINHQYSRSDIQADGSLHQHEALQKLATFFHSPKPVEPAASSTEPETSPVIVQQEAAQPHEAGSAQEMDFDQPEMFILPPPDLYADLTSE